MSDFIIGIDGGGSKTAVILADREGILLGRGESGPSNYHFVGKENAFAALDKAISMACSQAGLPEQAVSAAVMGMSGIDLPEDSAVFESWITNRFPGAGVKLINDGQIALAAGTPQGWGVVIVAGTGSIIFGQDEQGRTARAGGWGYLLGDEGSGYVAALAALQAVAQAYDGCGPATSLTQRILAYYRVASPPDLLNVVYRRENSRDQIARLSRLIDEEALAGDNVAQRIIQQAAEGLAAGVQAVAVKKLHLPKVPIALAGGFLVHGRSLQTALLAKMKTADIKIDSVNSVDEPVWGAVRLAMRMLK